MDARKLAVRAGLAMIMVIMIGMISVADTPPVYLPLILDQESHTPTASPTHPPSPTATPTTTPTTLPDGAVEVLAYCQHDTGYLYFVHGEVRNDTSAPVATVRITATGKDVNGDAVWQRSGETLVSVLNPGDKAPFRIWDQSGNIPPELVSIELGVDWLSATRSLQSLTVLSQELNFEDSTMVFTGTARNDTNRLADRPLAVVSVYQSITEDEAVLVGSGLASTVPPNVAPGETCTFRIEVHSSCSTPDRWNARVFSTYLSDPGNATALGLPASVDAREGEQNGPGASDRPERYLGVAR